MKFSAEATIDQLLEEFDQTGFDGNRIRAWSGHRNEVFRRNRQQALTGFPVLSGLLALYPEIPLHMEIQCVIDRGNPLLTALAECLGVSKGSIRFLQGKGIALVGKVWFEHPLLHVLDAQIIGAGLHVPEPVKKGVDFRGHDLDGEEFVLLTRMGKPVMLIGVVATCSCPQKACKHHLQAPVFF